MTCLLVSFSGAVWCFLLRLDRVRLAVSAPGRFIFYGNVFSTGAHQTIPLKAVNTEWPACCAAKHCSNPQNLILNSTGDSPLSKKI